MGLRGCLCVFENMYIKTSISGNLCVLYKKLYIIGDILFNFREQNVAGHQM